MHLILAESARVVIVGLILLLLIAFFAAVAPLSIDEVDLAQLRQVFIALLAATRVAVVAR